MTDLKKYIRDIPDFPKSGIIFKDITPLLASPDAFSFAVQKLAEPFKNKSISKVVGIEARGFLFAAPVAIELNTGVIPIRKPGKLPYTTVSQSYSLEYGTDTMEIHSDGISSGERVLLLDDVLATGGTTEAACKLIEKLGGIIAGVVFLIELEFLKGRQKIAGYPVFSLLTF
jgi:adenine phosphoribosyltransferase